MSDEQVNSKEPILEAGKFDSEISGNTAYVGGIYNVFTH